MIWHEDPYWAHDWFGRVELMQPGAWTITSHLVWVWRLGIGLFKPKCFEHQLIGMHEERERERETELACSHHVVLQFQCPLHPFALRHSTVGPTSVGNANDHLMALRTRGSPRSRPNRRNGDKTFQTTPVAIRGFEGFGHRAGHPAFGHKPLFQGLRFQAA